MMLRDHDKDVALLTEGVDRNAWMLLYKSDIRVALLTEGVDRNRSMMDYFTQDKMSPSSRRAWIEIRPP